MKPDAWKISDPDGELATTVTLRPQNPISETGLVIDGLYTLATVRKWLEEPPSKEMLESVFQLKANDPEKQDMADLMTRVVHFDICERMLAAKLREIENDT